MDTVRLVIKGDKQTVSPYFDTSAKCNGSPFSILMSLASVFQVVFKHKHCMGVKRWGRGTYASFWKWGYLIVCSRPSFFQYPNKTCYPYARILKLTKAYPIKWNSKMVKPAISIEKHLHCTDWSVTMCAHPSHGKRGGGRVMFQFAIEHWNSTGQARTIWTAAVFCARPCPPLLLRSCWHPCKNGYKR